MFIVGSDVRGTVYGIFELAERLGISPWIWWADATPERVDIVSTNIEKGKVHQPSVQYRGIFLNDEDWSLLPWAAKNFDVEHENIGGKTYQKIFELLLRLKANTIWPAMHPGTQAFFRNPANQQMARQYHIFVGSSHAEPMLRNNVDEWDKNTMGDYNYVNNRQQVKKYWEQRVEQLDNQLDLPLFTIGMRGIHDSKMLGAKSQQDSLAILAQVLNDQRNMLTQHFKQDAKTIPQMFIPYKEVLALYNLGLKVPEDVTLVWPDDNYGYIRRLSSKQEQQRIGGSGVYYHLSYWGRPHDYLWLSTTQPGLIWYEMSRAYANGANKIWIANVGDIKPAEYNTEFFLDLAWDINSISANSISKHKYNWLTREFGLAVATQLTETFNQFYQLAFIRRPEFMGWSQTEPTTQTHLTEFNLDTLRERLAAYQNMLEAVDKHKPTDKSFAYFQLVEYPIKGAYWLNAKFIYRHLAALTPNSQQADVYMQQAEDADKQIKLLTQHYNSVSNGKWQHFMHDSPRSQPVFKSVQAIDTSVQPTYNWTNQTPLVLKQAGEFSQTSAPKPYAWQQISQLGFSQQAMTLAPFIAETFAQQQPWLEYQVELANTGLHKVHLRFLPIHANDFNHQISVEANGRPLGDVYINTKGRSEQWKQDVLRNYHPVTLPFDVKKAGKQTIRIYFNHSNIVLDQLAVFANDQQVPYQL